MQNPPPEYSFTPEEWSACLKVLSALKDNPFHNPDNELFGTLLSKVYKNAKKSNRSESYTSKKAADLLIRLDTEISKNATAGQTLYSEGHEKHEHRFTALKIPKNCYACNGSYTLAHFFYDRLCERCAVENYEKRFQNIDLRGRKAILTGGRVKVGFATALKLLRNGAHVTLTSRFPALALQEFCKQEDYSDWEERLDIYGLDLRNLQAVEKFIAYYKATYDSLDILINNAAQTIKYTDAYYLPLWQNERLLLGDMDSHPRLRPNTTPVISEVKALEYQQGVSTEVRMNRFGQPVDEREQTSWNSKLDEISMYELVEVNLINHIAPYFLVKELKPWLKRSKFKETFIVNVTSSEGIFSYANRTNYHPHTNMTKAALNMMTLTSAKEFTEDRIYMNCVDVGWISTGARESLREKQFENGYIPPLDSVDGASRIFDPIVQGMQGNLIFGTLLKNYRPSEW